MDPRLSKYPGITGAAHDTGTKSHVKMYVYHSTPKLDPSPYHVKYRFMYA